MNMCLKYIYIAYKKKQCFLYLDHTSESFLMQTMSWLLTLLINWTLNIVYTVCYIKHGFKLNTCTLYYESYTRALF